MPGHCGICGPLVGSGVGVRVAVAVGDGVGDGVGVGVSVRVGVGTAVAVLVGAAAAVDVPVGGGTAVTVLVAGTLVGELASNGVAVAAWMGVGLANRNCIHPERIAHIPPETSAIKTMAPSSNPPTR